MIEEATITAVNGLDIFIGLILFWFVGAYYLGNIWFENADDFDKCLNHIIVMVIFSIPAYGGYIMAFVLEDKGQSAFMFMSLYLVSLIFVIISGLDILKYFLNFAVERRKISKTN